MKQYICFLFVQVFKIKPDQEGGVGGYICDRMTHRTGQISLATQTGEVTYTEIPDGVAPGMPLNPNLSVMYHGAWPIDKGSIFKFLLVLLMWKIKSQFFFKSLC